MLTIIKKRKRNFKFNILSKTKSCINKEIHINNERIYCKMFYGKLLLVKPVKREYALIQKPSKVCKNYIQNIINTTNFESIDLLINNTSLKYLYELCFIICFNYSIIDKETVNIFQDMFNSIDSSYKGVLGEELICNILKSKLKRLKYTGSIPHCADLKSSKYFIEIKNYNMPKPLEIPKFCYDIIYQYIKTNKYKFGIFIHFFNNNLYYYIDINEDGQPKILKSESFNMYLHIPFLGIPFSDIYKIDEILTEIELQMCCLDKFYGYKQLYIISKKFKNNLNDIIKLNVKQKKNKLYKFILHDTINNVEFLMKENRKLKHKLQRKDEKVKYLKAILKKYKITY